jgi:hypothetical protein
MPTRVQLSRERGWKMPANTVKVDRTTKFGNPFTPDRYGREQAVALFTSWVTGEMTDEFIMDSYPQLIAKHLVSRRKAVWDSVPTLVGKSLACWCSLDGPCHADTLLEIAKVQPGGGDGWTKLRAGKVKDAGSEDKRKPERDARDAHRRYC